MTRKSTQRQILVAVGRYVKQVDYEMVQRMRREKYRTDDATVGAYTAVTHPEQFDMIVRNLREDGLVRNPQRRTKSMGARWTSPAMSYEAATNYYPTKAAAEKKAEELRTYDEDWTYVVEEGSRGWRVGMYDEDGLKVANWSDPVRNPRLVANPYKEKILLPSGNVQYVYSEQDVAKRHAEKAQRIEQLKTKEQRLRSAVKRDTEAGDPVATAVALIMATYERVGNNESAAEGHFGVTGWQARHFTREGNKYRIDYVGKSGVEQSKVIDQPWLVEALAKHLRKKRKGERVLPVSASTVNRYLADYDVSAKDLRGYGANTEMQKELTRLRKRGPALATLKPKDVIKTLKAEFNAALTAVAAKLGHTTSVLRKQYLVPALEPMYIESGAVLRTFA